MWRVNHRLGTAMMQAGVTAADLAMCCGVDAKTVERWISPGRVPHRTHRWAAARRLGHEESYLRPQVALSRLRHAVPCFPSVSEAWLRLLEAYGMWFAVPQDSRRWPGEAAASWCAARSDLADALGQQVTGAAPWARAGWIIWAD
jgi:transcriptional regulator with XRE-family HTH domain